VTNLTTLAACKQEFGIASATTTWDGVLASEIARASGLIASACEREFGVTARVERYDAHGQRTLNLRQYPIVTDPLQGGQAVDIRQDTTWAFAAATIIPTTEYYVDAATGEVTFLYALARGRAYGESGALADPTDSANGTTGVGRKAVQVTYTSGYLTIRTRWPLPRRASSQSCSTSARAADCRTSRSATNRSDTRSGQGLCRTRWTR